MAEVADSTAAVVFMEAEGLAEAGGRMAAGCNAAAGGDLADIRLADIADMGERDTAEEGSVAGLALRAGVLRAMRRDFPMRARR